jgi:hypothetical protein
MRRSRRSRSSSSRLRADSPTGRGGMASPRRVFRMRAAKRWLPRVFSQRNREGDAACDDPFSSEGAVSVASARATQSPSLQEFFERGVVIRSSRARSRPCRETSRVPPSARESQNVPVSYPRRIEIAPVQATHHAQLQGFCASPLTDSNRRPPPYHGGFALRLCDLLSSFSRALSLHFGRFLSLLHPSL